LEAKIENFNIVPYTSVLPKELYGKIYPVDKVAQHFKHGAVLEVIIAGNGARSSEHRAIATGVGICWGQNEKGELIGGWAAEYVEYFDTWIDADIARAHTEMWLNKSLNHELEIRGVKKHSDFQIFNNYLNITKPFGYCLTALGFLNFQFANPVVVK
jgi:arginine decarboxylase